MRLSKLADELGVSTQDLIRKCKELGLEVGEGGRRTLTRQQVSALRRAFGEPADGGASSEPPAGGLHIGLFGIPRSGKTALLGVLVHYLLVVRGNPKALATQLGGWQPEVPHGQVRNEAQQVCEALLQGRNVPPTSKEMYRARAFSFYNRKEWYTYETHDTSGENLREFARDGSVPEHVLASLTRDAARSAGHIFLIDPTETGGSLESQDWFWCNVLDRLTAQEGTKEYRRPVIFVITKADDPSVAEDLAMPPVEKRRAAVDNPVMCQVLIERQNRAARAFVANRMPQTWGLMNPDLPVRRLRNAHVIAVSATGGSPHELGQTARLEPWRIAEPFRWVLDKLRPWYMRPKVQRVLFCMKALGLVAATCLFGLLVLIVYSGRYLHDIEKRTTEAINSREYDKAAGVLQEAVAVPGFVAELPYMPELIRARRDCLRGMQREVGRTIPISTDAAKAVLEKMQDLPGTESDEECRQIISETTTQVENAEESLRVARLQENLLEKYGALKADLADLDFASARVRLEEMRESASGETDSACRKTLSEAVANYSWVKDKTVREIVTLRDTILRDIKDGKASEALEDNLRRFMRLVSLPGIGNETEVINSRALVEGNPKIREAFLGYYKERFDEIKKAAEAWPWEVRPTSQAEVLLESIQASDTKWDGPLAEQATHLKDDIANWIRDFRQDEQILDGADKELDRIEKDLSKAETNCDATLARAAEAALEEVEKEIDKLSGKPRAALAARIERNAVGADDVIRRREKFDEHVEDGNKAGARGNLREAVKCYKAALERYQDKEVQDNLNRLEGTLARYDALLAKVRTNGLRNLRETVENLKEARDLWPEGKEAEDGWQDITTKTKQRNEHKLAQAALKASRHSYDDAFSLAYDAYQHLGGVAGTPPFDGMAQTALNAAADHIAGQIEHAKETANGGALSTALKEVRAAILNVEIVSGALVRNDASAEVKRRFAALKGTAEQTKREIIPPPWKTVFEEQVKSVNAESQTDTVFVRLYANELDMEFVLIEPGSNSSGSSGAKGLSGPYYILTTEVTQLQYEKVMGESKPDWNRSTANHPAHGVTWHEAKEFCKRLSARSARDGVTYTLPSEAQWEYACRAGTSTPYYCGTGMRPEFANYKSPKRHAQSVGSSSIRAVLTTPVRTYPANPWGLFDMTGNVWEWCRDPFRLPGGSAIGADQKVRRGGSYLSGVEHLKSSSRERLGMRSARPDIGFRIVYEPKNRTGS